MSTYRGLRLKVGKYISPIVLADLFVDNVRHFKKGFINGNYLRVSDKVAKVFGNKRTGIVMFEHNELFRIEKEEASPNIFRILNQVVIGVDTAIFNESYNGASLTCAAADVITLVTLHNTCRFINILINEDNDMEDFRTFKDLKVVEIDNDCVMFQHLTGQNGKGRFQKIGTYKQHTYYEPVLKRKTYYEYV